MDEITSVNNQIVKEAQKFQQKKYRDSEKKFLLEGFKSIDEAAAAGIEIEYIFINKNSISKYNFFSGRKILTNEQVLKKVSTTVSAPEAVAVANQKTYSQNEFKNYKNLILLENIKDLGNLGTIFRTAAAFGIDGIILYGECTDIYNPKCVRSSVGNLWKVPFIYIKDFNILKELFSDRQIIATLPLSKNNLKNYKFKEKTLIMFGAEADGLSTELKIFSTDNLKIEMKKNVESLNLATSCAVVSYYLMINN